MRFPLILLFLSILTFASCEKEALILPENVLSLEQNIGDKSSPQYSLKFTSMVEEGRVFIPAFAAMSLDITSSSKGTESVKVFIPRPDSQSNSKLFNFNLNSFASEYLNGVDIESSKSTYTNANRVLMAISDEQGGERFVTKIENLKNSTANIRYTSGEGNKSICTCWYWDTYVNGQLVQSDLVGCDCPCDDPDSSITCGNGGGGGGSGTGVLTNDDDGTDCESFQYVSNGALQVAGVRDMSLLYSHFQFDGYEVGFTFDWYWMPEIYFEFSNLVSAGAAAQLTAGFIDAAVNELEDFYGLHPPTDVRFQEDFMTILNRLMGQVGGQATFENTYGVPLHPYSSTVWGNGDCM